MGRLKKSLKKFGGWVKRSAKKGYRAGKKAGKYVYKHRAKIAKGARSAYRAYEAAGGAEGVTRDYRKAKGVARTLKTHAKSAGSAVRKRDLIAFDKAVRKGVKAGGHLTRVGRKYKK